MLHSMSIARLCDLRATTLRRGGRYDACGEGTRLKSGSMMPGQLHASFQRRVGGAVCDEATFGNQQEAGRYNQRPWSDERPVERATQFYGNVNLSESAFQATDSGTGRRSVCSKSRWRR